MKKRQQQKEEAEKKAEANEQQGGDNKLSVSNKYQSSFFWITLWSLQAAVSSTLMSVMLLSD